MNVVLWILQAALAFLYLAGGAYKVFKVDELANHVRGLPRGGWRALGVLEMLGGILLIVPVGRPARRRPLRESWVCIPSHVYALTSICACEYI